MLEVTAPTELSPDPAPRRAGAWFRLEHALLALPLAFLAILFLYPLAYTVASSFGGADPMAYYREVFADEFFRRAILRTLWISALATLLALALAYPVAYEITRVRTRVRVAIFVAVLLTFWISVLIRAYSWVAILAPDGIVNDLATGVGLASQPIEFQGRPWGLTIGLTHFLLPYMVLVLIPSLRAVDVDLIAAARSLGATRRQTLTRVVLPMTAPGAAAACLLTFILAIGSFVLPVILGGPAVPFVANLVGSEVGRLQNFEVAAAMGVTLTVIVIAIYMLLLRLVDPTEIFGGDEGV